MKKTHQQLLHTLIIMIEVIKVGITKPNDTENRISNKMHYCLKQALTIMQWIERSSENLELSKSIDKFTFQQTTKRSREGSPMELDISEIDNDLALMIRPLESANTSPLSKSKRDNIRAYSSLSKPITHKNLNTSHRERSAMLLNKSDLMNKKRKILFSQATVSNNHLN